MRRTLSLTVLLAMPLLAGCKRSSSIVDVPGVSCEEIAQVRRMPFKKGQKVKDEAYNSLMAKGTAVLPCLVEKMTDTRLVPDPRSAPTVAGVTVADVALFVLCDISGEDFETFLPEAVLARLKDEGVYAYFEYVQTKASNRAVIQNKARDWLKARTSQQ